MRRHHVHAGERKAGTLAVQYIVTLRVVFHRRTDRSTEMCAIRIVEPAATEQIRLLILQESFISVYFSRLAYCSKEHLRGHMSRTTARSDGDRPRRDRVPRRDVFGQVSSLWWPDSTRDAPWCPTPRSRSPVSESTRAIKLSFIPTFLIYYIFNHYVTFFIIILR